MLAGYRPKYGRHYEMKIDSVGETLNDKKIFLVSACDVFLMNMVVVGENLFFTYMLTLITCRLDCVAISIYSLWLVLQSKIEAGLQ